MCSHCHRKSSFSPDGFPLVSVRKARVQALGAGNRRASAIHPESPVGVGTGVTRCLRCFGSRPVKRWLAVGLAPLNPSPQLVDTGVSPAWVKVCHPQALSWGGPFPPAKQLQTPQQTSCKVGSGGKCPQSSGHPEVSILPSEMQAGLLLKCSSLCPGVPSAVQHSPERG